VKEPPGRTLRWLLIPLLGALVVGFGTGHGAGASRDSLRYIRGAENIAHGHGYSVISHTGELESITHWPPLYSMVIAGPIAAGLSTTNAVRLVNMLSFLATLWLVGWLVRRLVPPSHAAPTVAMVAILASPAIVHNHLMTWSETIFVPLVLAGLVKMLDYATRDRIVDVVAAGAWLGLAAIDRYAGAAFIAGAGVTLLVWDWQQRRAVRIVRLITFGVMACLPTALWFARNYFTTRHAHDRPFQPRGLGRDQLRAAIDAVSQWLLPNGLGLRMRAAWLVLVVALVVVAVRRIPKRESTARDPQLETFGLLVALCVAAYLGFVLVTMMFFDYEVNFDVRMMSPIYVLLVIAFAAAAPPVFARPWSSTTKALVGVLTVSLVLLASDSAVHTWSARRDPAQFAGTRWTHASAWDTVKSYPATTPVYSLQTEVSEYFLDRGVQPLTAAGGDSTALFLHYPSLDGADASLKEIEALHARVLESTETVVVYAAKR
jgi:4-amino-4-deoxy-L-arabinose transferase-like glycosyltransferase